MTRRLAPHEWSDDFSPWGGPSPPEDYRRWHLQDRLEQIDVAEKALTRGCDHYARVCHLAALAGRTPDEARAAAHATYGTA